MLTLIRLLLLSAFYIAVLAVRRPLLSTSFNSLPALLYYNETYLGSVRAELAASSSSHLFPAYSALLASVNAEVQLGPWTVTAQTGAGPADATNRSYVSIAPY